MRLIVVKEDGSVGVVEVPTMAVVIDGERLDKITANGCDWFFTKNGHFDGCGKLVASPAEFPTFVEAPGEQRCGTCGATDSLMTVGDTRQSAAHWRTMYRAALNNFVNERMTRDDTKPHAFTPQGGHDADICEHCDELQSHIWHEVYELRKAADAVDPAGETKTNP